MASLLLMPVFLCTMALLLHWSNHGRTEQLPFINGNLLYDEIGLDPEKDFSSGNHLSVTGAEKTTKYLAQFLRENYQLENHREDERYSRWEYNMQQSKKDRQNVLK